MEKQLQNFIISKLPKQYKKIHQVIEVMGIEEHTTILKIYAFKRTDLEPIIDYVETRNITGDVRDYKLQKLLQKK